MACKEIPKVTSKKGEPIITCENYCLWGLGGLGFYSPTS